MNEPVLWHYTCEHSHEALGGMGTLLPLCLQPEVKHLDLLPPWAAPLALMVWATDLDHPDPYALGLQRQTLECDRIAYRYVVPEPMFQRWGRVRSRFAPALLDALEYSPGAEPAHWFVTFRPVPAVLSVFSNGAP